MIGRTYLVNLEASANSAQEKGAPLRLWPQDLGHLDEVRRVAPEVADGKPGELWERSVKGLDALTPEDLLKQAVGVGRTSDGLVVYRERVVLC